MNDVTSSMVELFKHSFSHNGHSKSMTIDKFWSSKKTFHGNFSYINDIDISSTATSPQPNQHLSFCAKLQISAGTIKFDCPRIEINKCVCLA